MRILKPTRKVTYRNKLTPCIIFEGDWLTTKYGVKLGDDINVKFKKKSIVLEMIPVK